MSKKSLVVLASAVVALSGCSQHKNNSADSAVELTTVFATAQPGTTGTVRAPRTSASVPKNSEVKVSATSKMQEPQPEQKPVTPVVQQPAAQQVQQAPVAPQGTNSKGQAYQAPARQAPVQKTYQAPATVQKAPAQQAPVQVPAPDPAPQPAAAPVVDSDEPSGNWRGLQQLQQAWDNRPAAQKGQG